MSFQQIKFRRNVAFNCFVILCIFGIIIYLNQPVSTKIPSHITPLRALVEKYMPLSSVNKDVVYNEDFQIVSGGNRSYVYSAYLDEKSHEVRVIGVTYTNHTGIHCVLWCLSACNVVTHRRTKGTIVIIPDNHHKRYSPSFILCPYKGNNIPEAVSIVIDKNEKEPSNVIQVRRSITSTTKQHEFAVCVPPLQHGYGNIKELVEWLELVQLQGITSVTFYVYDVTEDVQVVLKHYQNIGLVKVLPWGLADEFCKTKDPEVHYCAQITAINDCVYRHRGQSRFVSSFDLDEAIVPQQDTDFTWMDMFSKLPQHCTYLFRHALFRVGGSNLTISNSSEVLKIQAYQMKDSYTFAARQRSKWIVRPECAVTMGIHESWKLRGGDEYTVPIEIGLLQHYRKHKVGYPHNVNITQHLHTKSLKYHTKLQSRVDHVYNVLENTTTIEVS